MEANLSYSSTLHISNMMLPPHIEYALMDTNTQGESLSIAESDRRENGPICSFGEKSPTI
jgi:hypothetical protein